MRRVRFFCEVATFRLLLALARLTPRRWLLTLGSVAGRVGYRIDRRHRRIAIDNARTALDVDPHTARRIVHSCWRHFGRITLDALNFPRFDRDSVGELVHYEGLEHIRAAYARGKGVLLFSAHYGHWELTALMQGHLGLPLNLVARPLDNPELERLLARLRGLSGNRIIHKRNAIREILRAISDSEGVAIVLDQDARQNGVFVPFFGRPASTTPTLALVALRTGATVIPTYSLLGADGSYTIVYEPPVAVDATADREADVRRITERCTAHIERWVRTRPELWLWMHRRWKTRPPDAAAVTTPGASGRRR